MNRRGFLSGILAACAAPAIVRADSLMRILPTETIVLALQDVTMGVRVAGNQLLTLDMITAEALRIAHEKCVFIGAARSSAQYDAYSDSTQVVVSGTAKLPIRKGGDTIRIHMPGLYSRARA